MPEVDAMGRKSHLEDELHPLGDTRNALEDLHSVDDVLRPRHPQSGVGQPRLVGEIPQVIGVVGCHGQGAPGSLSDTAVTDRG